MIRKILVANRGEIAIRVMRSIREMGLTSVAVYSDVDRASLHTRYADEAIHIGGAASKDSYLLSNKIIQAALDAGCEAIHPGYGFLSENPDFAEKVALAGLVFIGPSAHSIRLMGNKISAKLLAKTLNVPLVPGTEIAIKDATEALQIADQIGYPLLIKAAAGGGGKGMRLVESADEIKSQLERAMSEALSSFGDESVFIERYITSPRHIEIQVIADNHGNVVHLFERECSIQRRHQKLVEEAPSALLSSQVRQQMGQCAVDLAKACQYSGAGTVEFVVDQNQQFYFLEMNTRLQVEHPVTELITGIDLVKEQIKIAAGEILSVTQQSVSINGHAIELRICAEDPRNNFLPDIGKLTRYSLPHGPCIRVDNGYEEGMEIPVYYDPLLAKLMVWAPTRLEAIDRMIRAIREYEVSGVRTTLPFGEFVMHHQAFRSGVFDTGFVREYYTEHTEHNTDEIELVGAIATALFSSVNHNQLPNEMLPDRKSKWKTNRLA